MKKFLSILLIVLYAGISFVPLLSFAEDDAFVLIPEAKGGDTPSYSAAVKRVGENSGKSFWKVYNKEAKGMDEDLGGQIGSGIMNRDTILHLLNRVVIFIANSALVVGAAMVIYAGYLYASHVFSGADVSSANNAIKYAVIGIVVVIFSYTILRWVLHAFL